MHNRIKQARNYHADRVGDAHAIFKDLIDNLTRTCLNCLNWEQQSDEIYICKKFNLKPPPRIIINGCEEHSDIIPF